MKKKAENDFILLTDLSYKYGLIDKLVYIERMACLYDLTDIEPEIIKHILPPYGQSVYNSLVENVDEQNFENQGEFEEKFGAIEEITNPDSTILQLYRTNNSGKECRWEFYEKDADPHPSVPHGHGIQKTNLRLDPYRRKIFKKQNGLTEIGLEEKKFIKALWNDDDFRDYTLRALKNFITSGTVGQNYNWYGIREINSPYRLPRKRK
jgi:hypothetical protein